MTDKLLSSIWHRFSDFINDPALEPGERSFASGYLLHEAGEHSLAFQIFADLSRRGILPAKTAYAAGVCLMAQAKWAEALPWFERFEGQPFLIKRREVLIALDRPAEAEDLASRLTRATLDFVARQDEGTSHGFPNYERDPAIYQGIARRYAPYFKKDHSLLEYGCNSGQMLTAFYEAGHRNNGCIEISRTALDEFARRHPEAYADTQVHCGDIEEIAATIPDRSFDVVYSMAALSNLIRDDAVRDMARIARSFVWVNEVDPRNLALLPSGVFFHDYTAILTGAGFELIEEKPVQSDDRYDRVHVMRLFRRKV